jgi:hypothetical protein
MRPILKSIGKDIVGFHERFPHDLNHGEEKQTEARKLKEPKPSPANRSAHPLPQHFLFTFSFK